MTGNYYILENEVQKGPFTFEELTATEIGLHDKILSPETDTWQEACDLPELFVYFEARGVVFPTEDNLASFWWRLLAFFIDYVIISLFLGFVLALLISYGLVVKVQTYDDLVKVSNSYRLQLQLAVYTTLIIYNSIGEVSPMKGSLGKKICGLVVVDTDGVGLTFPRSLLRSMGKVVSLFFYGAGFISIFFSEYRQALHDYFAKCYVVKV